MSNFKIGDRMRVYGLGLVERVEFIEVRRKKG